MTLSKLSWMHTSRYVVAHAISACYGLLGGDFIRQVSVGGASSCAICFFNIMLHQSLCDFSSMNIQAKGEIN